MSISCVVCKGSTQCERCLIKQLYKIIEKQNYELSYLRKGSNQQLKLPTDYSHYFETDNKFLPIRYYGEMSDYQFLTITFDPSKFGLFNQPVDEQNYIFSILKQSLNKQLILQLTGCFEYQANGTTHAHIIIKSSSGVKEVEDFFRPHFTDDKRNRYAVKSYILQKEKCETYLQKESTEYFRHDLTFEDINDVSPFDFDKIVVNTPPDEVNKIIAMFKASQEHDLKLFTKRMTNKYLNKER